MLTAGVDIGSSATKSVLLQDGNIIAKELIPTGVDSVASGETVLNNLLIHAGISREDLDYCVATGYGRINASYADRVITEITCHAKGMHYFLPSVRTILDMGGQDCKVISCDKNGMVQNFVMNDRCAAGTGRYLERISMALHVPLEEIGPRSLHTVEGAVKISSFCTVFAEGDAILMLRRGKHIEDILAGICDGIAERICKQASKLVIKKDFAVSGGIAQNEGITRRLSDRLGIEVVTPSLPQYAGAVGAAVLGADLYKRKEKKK